jgi:dihydroorotate dehydrogenase
MTLLSTTLEGFSFPSCWIHASGACSGTQAVASLSNGEDGHGALSRGAKAVHIGSSLTKAGPAVFARLQQKVSVTPGRREGSA